MPASYIHICAASDAVLKWAPEDEKINLNAVLAGAEGPDPLFYSFITKKGAQSLPDVASRMHKTRTGAFLDELAGNAGSSPLLKSFVYGFLSHYATDTVCHPYIYTKSVADDGSLSNNKHCKYEHSVETYVYRRKGNMVGLPKQLEGYARLSGAEKKEIAVLMSKSISAVFPETPVSVAEVRKSFRDAVFFSRLLRNCALKKRSLLLSIAKKLPIAGLVDSHLLVNAPVTAFDKPFEVSGYRWEDMLNKDHKEWRSRWEPDVVRTESFDELFGKSVERSKALMAGTKAFFDGKMSAGDFSALHGDMSYDSGIAWEKTK